MRYKFGIIFITVVLCFFSNAFAQQQRVEIKNWIPTIEEQTHMMDQLGFAVQERIEIQYTQQGQPLYRYSLCQYRKQNDELIFFNDSSNHDPWRNYNKNQQNPMLRYTYKDVERLYSYGECSSNGLCEDDLAFINWIKNNDEMNGNWFNKSWVQDNSVFVKDQALQLNCFYYLNDTSDHMQDYFLLMHQSMDDLFDCIENDAWFKGGSLAVAGIFLISRYPGITKHLGKFFNKNVLSRVFANRSSIQILQSYRPLLQYIEKTLVSGRYNPLQFKFMQNLMNGIFLMAVDKVAMTSADHALAAIGGDVYSNFKNYYLQGWIDDAASLLLDFVIGPPRHFGGLSRAKGTILADDQVYTEMNGYQRMDGKNNGEDYSRIGAEWDEEQDHSLIEFIAFKKRILSGACALNNFLDSDPSDMGGFSMHHHVHKIRRRYPQSNVVDNRAHYLELYYGYFRDALNYAGMEPRWNDTWNDKSMLIIPLNN